MNEIEIKNQSFSIKELTDTFTIRGNEDLNRALEIIRSVRNHKEMILKYWKSAKESAKKTYQDISLKERCMLDICEKSEKKLKDKISRYTILHKAYRNKLLMDANQEKTLQVDRLISQAKKLQTQGKLPEAEEKFKQAEKLQNIKNSLSERLHIEGLGFQKRFKCRVIDNELVPAFFDGNEIREVNMKKILDLHKENPSVTVPGVEFYQEEILMIRGN